MYTSAVAGQLAKICCFFKNRYIYNDFFFKIRKSENLNSSILKLYLYFLVFDLSDFRIRQDKKSSTVFLKTFTFYSLSNYLRLFFSVFEGMK